MKIKRKYVYNRFLERFWDHTFAKIISKYYLSTAFFNFILNVVIKYFLAELYVSAYFY